MQHGEYGRILAALNKGNNVLGIKGKSIYACVNVPNFHLSRSIIVIHSQENVKGSRLEP